MQTSGAFLVQHAYEDANGDEHVKLIGLYTTKQKARAAVDRLRKMPGFKNYPDGFSINRYDFDIDHWQEGFVRMTAD